jgi:hypothetical protein
MWRPECSVLEVKPMTDVADIIAEALEGAQVGTAAA